ncbi:MAG: hypothetical protein ABJC10_11460 [Acidobacteriota bacterium]
MDETENTHTPGKRQIVESLDREFARLYVSACVVIEHCSPDILYADRAETASASGPLPSVGESVLRSAAAIEQTFGGITANLWDDPFEWTLPEYLSTPVKVRDYLAEVEATRRRAFSSFADDACLRKQIAVPAGGTRLLIDLLLETLRQADVYQTQAAFVLRILWGISLPGLLSNPRL